jgi:hypothetical protein
LSLNIFAGVVSAEAPGPTAHASPRGIVARNNPRIERAMIARTERPFSDLTERRRIARTKRPIIASLSGRSSLASCSWDGAACPARPGSYAPPDGAGRRSGARTSTAPAEHRCYDESRPYLTLQDHLSSSPGRRECVRRLRFFVRSAPNPIAPRMRPFVQCFATNVKSRAESMRICAA